MHRIRSTLVLLAALLTVACDDTVAEPEEPGRFTAEVSGSLEGTLEGSAVFGEVEGTESGAAFVLSLVSDETTVSGQPARILTFVHEAGVRPDSGTVPLLDVAAWDDTAQAAFPTEPYAVYAALAEALPLFHSAGGTLLITESAAGLLTGEFTVPAQRLTGADDGSATLTITGSFRAAAGSPRVSF